MPRRVNSKKIVHAVAVKSKYGVDQFEKALDDLKDGTLPGFEFFRTRESNFGALRHSRLSAVVVTRDWVENPQNSETADIEGLLSCRRLCSGRVYVTPEPEDGHECAFCAVEGTQTVPDPSGFALELAEFEREPLSAEPELSKEECVKVLSKALLQGWLPPDKDVETSPDHSKASREYASDWYAKRKLSALGSVEDALAWLVVQSLGSSAASPDLNIPGIDFNALQRSAYGHIVDSDEDNTMPVAQRAAVLNRSGTARVIVIFDGDAPSFRRYLQGLFLCDADLFEQETPFPNPYDSYGFDETARPARPTRSRRAQLPIIYAENIDSVTDTLARGESLVLVHTQRGQARAIASCARRDDDHDANWRHQPYHAVTALSKDVGERLKVCAGLLYNSSVSPEG